jgi:membrane glycosyltransferase
MKPQFSSLQADKWSNALQRVPADLPAEAPIAMPIQEFGECPGRYTKPPTSPLNITDRRLLLFTTVFALTCISFGELVRVSIPGGISFVETAILALFLPLFAWIAFSFGSALAGFCVLLWGRGEARLLSEMPGRPMGRTAVLMPIYNEDVDAVFRRLRAMADSLQSAAVAGAFDIFVLSDSTDAEIHAAERAAFERLRHQSPVRVYYRRRPQNIERKPGNIAEWVRRFGGAYSYMIVLDADSLMSGRAMLQLADAMEHHPKVGLIQTVPVVAGCSTLFGRWQQFAARLYGPVSTAGLLWWSGAEGSFWGHNAIVRVRAFAESCGLPALKGRAPFGGAIMSHDMVEAALLRRRGWSVHMVTMAEGSYEEYPPTPVDFAIRDRRWCQGNLQHLKLIPGRRLHWISRLHLLMGASAYLTSPLWAALIGVSLVQAAAAGGQGDILSPFSAMSGWLLLLTTALLVGPKLMSLIWTLIDRDRRAEYGGAGKLALGVLVDLPLAALLAPAMMVTQIGILIGLLSGRPSGWSAQRRDVNAITAAEAFSRYRPHLLTGLVLAGTCVAVPSMLLWLLPVVLGLLLSPVLVMLTSRRDLGLWMRGKGMMATPEELSPTPLLIDGGPERDNVVPMPHTAPVGRWERADMENWPSEGELVTLH